MPNKKNKPMNQKEDIALNPDNKIDQDFQGYPHGSARDETINPLSKEEGKTAATNSTDGEKIIIRPGERKSIDEQESDGSANAFDNK